MTCSSTEGLSGTRRARQLSVALMIRSSLLHLQSPSSFPTHPSSLAIKDAGVLLEKPNKTLCDHVIKGCTITHRHKGDELMLYRKPPDQHFLALLYSHTDPLIQFPMCYFTGSWRGTTPKFQSFLPYPLESVQYKDPGTGHQGRGSWRSAALCLLR